MIHHVNTTFQTVKLCPRWVAPNLLTLVGFLFCFGHFGLLALYDYDFRSATYTPGGDNQETVPGWAWFLVALFLFLAHTLDGIDGKQVNNLFDNCFFVHFSTISGSENRLLQSPG